jgi:hypothetical protein
MSLSVKNEFVDKYLLVGPDRFYKFLLFYAIKKLVKISDQEQKNMSFPDVEFLDYSEKFLILYRRDGDSVFLELSCVFRKAAHKIYRMMLKKGMTNTNFKFLNLVK